MPSLQKGSKPPALRHTANQEPPLLPAPGTSIWAPCSPAPQGLSGHPASFTRGYSRKVARISSGYPMPMGLGSPRGLLCAQCSSWLYKGATLIWLTEGRMQRGRAAVTPTKHPSPFPYSIPGTASGPTEAWDTKACLSAHLTMKYIPVSLAGSIRESKSPNYDHTPTYQH